MKTSKGQSRHTRKTRTEKAEYNRVFMYDSRPIAKMATACETAPQTVPSGLKRPQTAKAQAKTKPQSGHTGE